MNAAHVSQRLELGDVCAAWMAKVDEARPQSAMVLPDSAALAALLARLGVTLEDAAEVLRTMPSAERDPELWWLLERSREVLTRGLANRSHVGDPLPPLPPSTGMFPVHLILATCDAIRRCHREFGIPDDVSWQTLAYLGRATLAYRTLHGRAGIHLTNWDWLRFFGWLYQVGRLEALPYRLRTHPPEAGPLFWYDDEEAAQLGLPFRKGDPALSIHVPATGPLTPESCDDSFRRMRAAFTGVYADKPLRVATCTSWLLDEQLSEYLPEDSNIIAFRRRFQRVPGARDNDDAILHFVFGGDRPKELEKLPQRTALERAIVDHLRRGRHWRLRTGWLKLVD